ncbi:MULTISPECIES: hypothetical protein [Corynebacterium]|uniref:hypothetical protein n=1 Tax=Corynebacterium TaxID=1716 RepID=UPI00188A8B00|nr:MULTISPECIES: hypothetical protein [Corynebacterium]MBF4548085.1 hypothetical protein [Corynebacterium afermentans subsp. lipophilum]MCG7290103.1 hypothetical protein [Corynebacterium sp. ACRPZ]MCG7294719.1 hypothetical protein [Corynebacterium sp. ACRPY]WJY59640.1 hypothetical protein CAFEL_09510 [Corynebacterium afermentans subsp. lipophilum]
MRLNKTAIALTTAAALGAGVIPTAGAQESNAPKLDDGVQQATDSPNDADTGIFGNGTGDGAAQATGNAPENPNDQLLPGAPEGSEPASSNSLGTNEQAATETETATATATATETATAGDSGAAAGTEGTATGTATATATETATGTATATATPTTKDNTAAIVLGSLGALAGLGLIIAGVQYFVNKDGDLVKDPNRVDQPASPEEKAESDQVKKDHGEEIAQQVEANGGAPAAGNAGTGNAGAAANGAGNAATANGERGMNASTGVAELPAGLVALLILSIVGAAGYAFSRRETV